MLVLAGNDGASSTVVVNTTNAPTHPPTAEALVVPTFVVPTNTSASSTMMAATTTATNDQATVPAGDTSVSMSSFFNLSLHHSVYTPLTFVTIFIYLLCRMFRLHQCLLTTLQ